VAFDRDRNIEIALVPQAAAPGTAPATPTATGEPKEKTKVIIVAPPTGTEDPTKTGGTKKPTRTIDQNNPYQ
jgi:hypothetical protein